MNLFKISLRNIQKSWKDYSVYFMTLIIGVAIFYMFNSLADQGMTASLSASGYEIVKLMGSIIQGMSVGVSVVLGLLIVYANNFLIKRRKKEFGIYRMLGMGKRAVSRIILGETIVVGIISLVVGILLGVFGSQFLSIAVVKMFEADVREYIFTFSKSAVIKTVINFIVIFFVVSIFNTATVSKYQLIHLLNAEKRGEKKLIKNPVVSAAVTILAIGMLVYAYYMVGFKSNELSRNGMMICILMGIVSSFLFFIGLAGFMLEVLQKSGKTYFKGLNSFVIRQFCANVNSSAFSMALICLMLFLALSAFSAGFTIKNSLNDIVRKATPVDITIHDTAGSVVENFAQRDFDMKGILKEDYLEIPVYVSEDVTFRTTVGSVYEVASVEYPMVRWNTQELILSASDYNKLAERFGFEKLDLQGNSYADICNFQTIADYKNASYEKGDKLIVGSRELTNVPGRCIEGYLLMSGISGNTGVVVLPDELIGDESLALTYNGTFLAGDYKEKDKQKIYALEDKIVENMGSLTDYKYVDGEYVPAIIEYETKVLVSENSNGLSVLVVFVVLYMGVVFIISCAAILALKSLSDSIDAVKKYEILGKIGVEKKMMRGALFTQVLLSFGLPLVLAIVHTVFGLMYAKTILSIFFTSSMFPGIVSTAVVMVFLYGGYMLMTYLGSLRITNLE